MVERARPVRGYPGPLILVGAAVGLQVLGAILLKVMADGSFATPLLPTLGFAAVLALDFLRFVVWGSAHRRFPLSETYPLSSLFFPAMLVVSLSFGERITLQQVAGVLLIASGTAWMRWRAPQ